MDLLFSEFEMFADLIYNRCGLRFESKKTYFLSKRVEKRMNEFGFQNPSDYLRYLKYDDPQSTEFQNLVNLITTNETYFFRDYSQLSSFADHCLTEVGNNKAALNDYTIKIWCAGCSSGEEPYTLAIILHEILGNVKDWNLQIIASDIDETILKKARAGVFEERSVKDVPREYLDKYFTTRGGNYYINPQIKSMVQFEHLNFFDRASMRNRRGFDFIFCRNVLIYFDDASRKNVVENFYLSLNPSGFIFLGSSESLSRITTAFTLKRMGDNLVYTKEKK